MSTVGPEGHGLSPKDRASRHLHRSPPSPSPTGSVFSPGAPAWAACSADRVLLSRPLPGRRHALSARCCGRQRLRPLHLLRRPPQPGLAARRRTCYDFGDSTFGGAPNRPHYSGRHVNVMGAACPSPRTPKPIAAVQAYLRSGQTETGTLCWRRRRWWRWRRRRGWGGWCGREATVAWPHLWVGRRPPAFHGQFCG